MVEERTTRQRIADVLRERSATPSDLAAAFDTTVDAVLTHVDHVAKSLDGADEELLAAPPECRTCGFADFDDLLNVPSRCPECKREDVAEPAFTIEPE